jgi:MFS family permease
MQRRIIAAVLLILTFLLGLIQYISALTIGAAMEGEAWFGLEKYILALGVVAIVFGVFALIGAYFALTKKSWAGALVGAILGIFSLGGFFVGPVLSITAVILIAFSKKEFADEVQPSGSSYDYGGTLPGALPPD